MANKMHYTMNPVPSDNPCDAEDNARTLDDFILTDKPTVNNRLKQTIPSLKGYRDKMTLDAEEAARLATQQAESYRDEAEQARDDAIAAASASGDFVFAKNLADMQSKLPLPNGKVIEVAVDADHTDSRTRYVVENGAPVFAINLDQVKFDLSKESGAGMVGMPNGGFLKDYSRSITPQSVGCAGNGDLDDSDNFIVGIEKCRLLGVPYVGAGKFKITKKVDLRGVECDFQFSEFIVRGDGQLIIGGRAGTSQNPDQIFGVALQRSVSFDPSVYEKPTVMCIGAKNQNIYFRYVDYWQFYQSTDPSTFPHDASQAYSNFYINFSIIVDIDTDPRYENGEQADGPSSRNQWFNSNKIYLNRCIAFEMRGSYRHNCNEIFGGTFESPNSYINIISGSRNQFFGARLEGNPPIYFGENTESNIIWRQYYGSWAHLMPRNITDLGMFNRAQTEFLQSKVKTRVFTINSETPKFNNRIPPYNRLIVGANISGSLNYAPLFSSDYFLMNGKKDILFFSTDSIGSRPQIRVYLKDSLGNEISDLNDVSFYSSFLTKQSNYLSGSFQQSDYSGGATLIFTGDKSYLISIQVVNSPTTEYRGSKEIWADLYSDYPIQAVGIDKICLIAASRPSQVIAPAGTIIPLIGGASIVVTYRLQTKLVSLSGKIVRVEKSSNLLGSPNPGDMISITSGTETFNSTILLVDSDSFDLSDFLPSFIVPGALVNITRIE